MVGFPPDLVLTPPGLGLVLGVAVAAVSSSLFFFPLHRSTSLGGGVPVRVGRVVVLWNLPALSLVYTRPFV